MAAETKTLATLLNKGKTFIAKDESGKFYLKFYTKDLDGGTNDILKYFDNQVQKLGTDLLENYSGVLVIFKNQENIQQGLEILAPTGEDLAKDLTMIYPLPSE